MEIQAIRRVGIGPTEAGEPTSEIAHSLVYDVTANQYDRQTAETLARASTWEYASASTFGTVMANHGLKGANIVSITVTNPALLVDTSALLVQSEGGPLGRRLVILCFRGTDPENAVNWMTNLSAAKQPFYTHGYVHGGFHRALVAMWPALGPLLKAATIGQNLCDALTLNVAPTLGVACMGGDQSHPPLPLDTEAANELAFYLCGHSLGGALAALAGAYIYSNHPRLRRLKLHEHLRGVYTYGQPMVGDAVFAKSFRDSLGKNLFRHVYRRDIVPRLPPRVMGKYEHVGAEYGSTKTGWVYRPTSANQAITLVVSNMLGVAAFVSQEVLSLRGRSRVSWADHLPLHYLRTSLAAPAGEELI